MTIRRNHYLEQRGHTWYYVRRVPARYQSIDKRRRVKHALHTDSLTIARERRDAMMDAENIFGKPPMRNTQACLLRSCRGCAVIGRQDGAPEGFITLTA